MRRDLYERLLNQYVPQKTHQNLSWFLDGLSLAIVGFAFLVGGFWQGFWTLLVGGLLDLAWYLRSR